MATINNKTTVDLNPSVIIDFSIKERSLFLDLINISSVPAIDVGVVFYSKIMGRNGSKDISALPIFQGHTYLAPFKKVSIFVDLLDIFFADQKAIDSIDNPVNIFNMEIMFKNELGNRFTKTIKYNLNSLNGLPQKSSTSQV